MQPKMASKLAPNRIFDAEAVRKPLGALLERSWWLTSIKGIPKVAKSFAFLVVLFFNPSKTGPANMDAVRPAVSDGSPEIEGLKIDMQMLLNFFSF